MKLLFEKIKTQNNNARDRLTIGILADELY